MRQRAIKKESALFLVEGCKCNRCGVLKPWDSRFYKSSRRNFRRTCLKCDRIPCVEKNNKIREERKKNPNWSPYKENEFKKCSGCKINLEKIHKNFSRSLTRPDGLQSKCRKCMTRLRRLRRQKNRDLFHKQRKASNAGKNNRRLPLKILRDYIKDIEYSLKLAQKELSKFKIKNCPICNSEFTSINKGTIYCSKACYRKHNYVPKIKPIRKCVICGAEYIGRNKYCSQLCNSRRPPFKLSMKKHRDKNINKNKNLGDLVYDNSLKKCAYCCKILPRIKSNFMKCLSTKDGLWAYCKICQKDRERKHHFRKYRGLLKSTDSKCYYCGDDLIWGEPRNWEIEHKIPIAKGGLNIRSNIVASCPKCNNEKYTMTDTEYLNYRKLKGLKINPERTLK